MKAILKTACGATQTVDTDKIMHTWRVALQHKIKIRDVEHLYDSQGYIVGARNVENFHTIYREFEFYRMSSILDEPVALYREKLS